MLTLSLFHSIITPYRYISLKQSWNNNKSEYPHYIKCIYCQTKLYIDISQLLLTK